MTIRYWFIEIQDADTKVLLKRLVRMREESNIRLTVKLKKVKSPKYIDVLTIVLNELSFEIITINETRIDNSFDDRVIGISSYDIVRHDRNRNGEGVTIYDRKNIPYIKRDDWIVQGLEAICIEIKKSKSTPFLIPAWYRPPDSLLESFDKFEIFYI